MKVIITLKEHEAKRFQKILSKVYMEQRHRNQEEYRKNNNVVANVSNQIFGQLLKVVRNELETKELGL